MVQLVDAGNTSALSGQSTGMDIQAIVDHHTPLHQGDHAGQATSDPME